MFDKVAKENEMERERQEQERLRMLNVKRAELRAQKAAAIGMNMREKPMVS